MTRFGVFAILTALACATLFFGCGEDSPTDPGLEGINADPDTVLALLSHCYSLMDSPGYEAILDSGYQFIPNPANVDWRWPNESWDLQTELGIAGMMFNKRYNQRGQRVNRIQLELSERSTVVDSATYNGKPPAETWYKTTAFVDLLVVIEDPDNEEGVINFVVLSDQVFTVRPDPNHEGCWLIYRQEDQEPIHKSGAVPDRGTESSSWGSVKTLFRCPSPAAIVTDDFVRAYSQMDSVGYTALFDPAFQFELLDSEVDPDSPNPWWDLDTELAIAGTMFNARYNDAGQRVERILLELTERTTTTDTTPYPGKPEGETWHRVTTFVDLLVVVEDPDDEEGVINFVVLSDQIFVIRPDPSREVCWLVYWQEDQEPINKNGAVPDRRTESSSWGAVKDMFR